MYCICGYMDESSIEEFKNIKLYYDVENKIMTQPHIKKLHFEDEFRKLGSFKKIVVGGTKTYIEDETENKKFNEVKLCMCPKCQTIKVMY